MADRERVGRDASPTAAVLDSQGVKTMEAGGPRGYDAGKKVLRRKRQALVDTDGRGLTLQARPGLIQDRDGDGLVLRASWVRRPPVQHAGRVWVRRATAPADLFSGGKQALGLPQDFRRDPLALGSGEARKPQGA